MNHLHKHAQINAPGMVAFTIFFVLAVGFILSQLSDTINTIRQNQLAITPTDKVIQRLVLYMLMPLIWVVYILFSIFLIFISTK
jgi:hypothetical protein